MAEPALDDVRSRRRSRWPRGSDADPRAIRLSRLTAVFTRGDSPHGGRHAACDPHRIACGILSAAAAGLPRSIPRSRRTTSPNSTSDVGRQRRHQQHRYQRRRQHQPRSECRQRRPAVSSAVSANQSSTDINSSSTMDQSASTSQSSTTESVSRSARAGAERERRQRGQRSAPRPRAMPAAGLGSSGPARRTRRRVDRADQVPSRTRRDNARAKLSGS